MLYERHWHNVCQFCILLHFTQIGTLSKSCIFHLHVLHVNIQLAQFQITIWDLHLHRVKKINSFFESWLSSSTVKPRVLKFLPNYPKKHQLPFNQISNQACNTLAAAAVNDQMPDLTVFCFKYWFYTQLTMLINRGHREHPSRASACWAAPEAVASSGPEAVARADLGVYYIIGKLLGSFMSALIRSVASPYGAAGGKSFFSAPSGGGFRGTCALFPLRCS